MLDKNTLRAELRSAIAEREKLRQNVEKAAAALGRANTLLQEAESRLAMEFADVDAAIAVEAT